MRLIEHFERAWRALARSFDFTEGQSRAIASCMHERVIVPGPLKGMPEMTRTRMAEAKWALLQQECEAWWRQAPPKIHRRFIEV